MLVSFEELAVKRTREATTLLQTPCLLGGDDVDILGLGQCGVPKRSSLDFRSHGRKYRHGGCALPAMFFGVKISIPLHDRQLSNIRVIDFFRLILFESL